ncbi:MAG: hypothetical protein RIQ72_558 [Candidatus Parcubacteria bacterium]
MNDSNFENIIKAYRKVSMTSQEKREVFKQSMLVIEKIEAVSLAHGDTKEFSALIQDQGDVSVLGAKSSGKKVFVSNWISYIKRRQFVPALVASFVLLFFGTTSMLAEEALPGDSLYSFKVSVNESVRDLTAVTDEAKAKLAVEMSSRRLEEAAVLSAQGKLDEKSKKILQDQFVKKADEVKNRVASLVSKNNLSAAQEVVVDFESALQTHELILASLSLTTQPDQVATVATISNPDTTETGGTVALSALHEASVIEAVPAPTLPQVSTLLATVKSELDTAKNTRINIQEKVQAGLVASSQASSTVPSNQSTVAQMVIESNIKEARFMIQDIQTELLAFSFGQSTLDLVQSRLADASSTIESVIVLAKSGKFTEASTEIRKVQRNLGEVETVLKLEKNNKGAQNGAVDFAAIISASSQAQATSATSTIPQTGQAGEASTAEVQTP